jgi:MATE family multidrug resistance protein
MVRLALPVVIAELGWITMGIVDTVMVGPLGPAALGAVGTGSTMFFALVVLGMGTLLALDTFVSQGFGAGQIAECHRWLLAGLQLAAVMSVALVVVALVGVALLPRAGLHPAVIVLLQPYLASLLWSIPPLLAFTVFRRYLQAMHVVRSVMAALISANLINVAANWALVYGHLGLPAFGVVGSAYATLAARVYLAGVLWAVILHRERKNPSGFHDVPWIIEWARMERLLRLGAPAAAQVMLEVGVFAVAGALAARITPDALAANQIVLNIAGFVFMVPFGLGSAAAVRVGHAVGSRDGARARRAGWVAIALAVSFSLVMSTTFAIAPGPFLRIFTRRHCASDRRTRTVDLCGVAALRRVPGRRDRCAPWSRRNAGADGGESSGTLGHRPAARLLLVLRPCVGRGRSVGWAVPEPGAYRRGAHRRLANQGTTRRRFLTFPCDFDRLAEHETVGAGPRVRHGRMGSGALDGLGRLVLRSWLRPRIAPDRTPGGTHLYAEPR